MNKNKFNDYFLKFGMIIKTDEQLYVIEDMRKELSYIGGIDNYIVKRYMYTILCSVIKNMCKRNKLKFDKNTELNIDSKDFGQTIVFEYNRNNNPIINWENINRNINERELLEEIFRPNIMVNMQMKKDIGEHGIVNNTEIDIPVYYSLSFNGYIRLVSRRLKIENDVENKCLKITEKTIHKIKKETEEHFKVIEDNVNGITFTDTIYYDSIILQSVTYLREIYNLYIKLYEYNTNKEDNKLYMAVNTIIKEMKKLDKIKRVELEYRDIPNNKIDQKIDALREEAEMLRDLINYRNRMKNK